MSKFFKCMKECKCAKLCGGGSEFIGNQGVQLEKLQWFERGATFHHFHSHLYIYIYIYIYIIPNNNKHI